MQAVPRPPRPRPRRAGRNSKGTRTQVHTRVSGVSEVGCGKLLLDDFILACLVEVLGVRAYHLCIDGAAVEAAEVGLEEGTEPRHETNSRAAPRRFHLPLGSNHCRYVGHLGRPLAAIRDMVHPADYQRTVDGLWSDLVRLCATVHLSMLKTRVDFCLSSPSSRVGGAGRAKRARVRVREVSIDRRSQGALCDKVLDTLLVFAPV